MSRRNRRRPADAEPLEPPSTLGERRDVWHGVDYAVRAVTGSGASKAYRCPGCDQFIRPATPHVVAWPADDPDADERRHWHTACWSARDHRGPGVTRSRSAPRY